MHRAGQNGAGHGPARPCDLTNIPSWDSSAAAPHPGGDTPAGARLATQLRNSLGGRHLGDLASPGAAQSPAVRAPSRAVTANSADWPPSPSPQRLAAPVGTSADAAALRDARPLVRSTGTAGQTASSNGFISRDKAPGDSWEPHGGRTSNVLGSERSISIGLTSTPPDSQSGHTAASSWHSFVPSPSYRRNAAPAARPPGTPPAASPAGPPGGGFWTVPRKLAASGRTAVAGGPVDPGQTRYGVAETVGSGSRASTAGPCIASPVPTNGTGGSTPAAVVAAEGRARGVARELTFSADVARQAEEAAREATDGSGRGGSGGAREGGGRRDSPGALAASVEFGDDIAMDDFRLYEAAEEAARSRAIGPAASSAVGRSAAGVPPLQLSPPVGHVGGGTAPPAARSPLGDITGGVANKRRTPRGVPHSSLDSGLNKAFGIAASPATTARGARGGCGLAPTPEQPAEGRQSASGREVFEAPLKMNSGLEERILVLGPQMARVGKVLLWAGIVLDLVSKASLFREMHRMLSNGHGGWFAMLLIFLVTACTINALYWRSHYTFYDTHPEDGRTRSKVLGWMGLTRADDRKLIKLLGTACAVCGFGTLFAAASALRASDVAQRHSAFEVKGMRFADTVLLTMPVAVLQTYIGMACRSPDVECAGRTGVDVLLGLGISASMVAATLCYVSLDLNDRRMFEEITGRSRSPVHLLWVCSYFTWRILEIGARTVAVALFAASLGGYIFLILVAHAAAILLILRFWRQSAVCPMHHHARFWRKLTRDQERPAVAAGDASPRGKVAAGTTTTPRPPAHLARHGRWQRFVRWARGLPVPTDACVLLLSMLMPPAGFVSDATDPAGTFWWNSKQCGRRRFSSLNSFNAIIYYPIYLCVQAVEIAILLGSVRSAVEEWNLMYMECALALTSLWLLSTGLHTSITYLLDSRPGGAFAVGKLWKGGRKLQGANSRAQRRTQGLDAPPVQGPAFDAIAEGSSQGPGAPASPQGGVAVHAAMELLEPEGAVDAEERASSVTGGGRARVSFAAAGHASSPSLGQAAGGAPSPSVCAPSSSADDPYAARRNRAQTPPPASPGNDMCASPAAPSALGVSLSLEASSLTQSGLTRNTSGQRVLHSLSLASIAAAQRQDSGPV
ncbi:unnamed protein product [Pedinophyceae sp. YPF-701]|nr:unnamed protein product [Pedinophyceae sp. YPF-701]